MWFLITLVAILGGFAYYKFTQIFSYWSQRGVTEILPESYLTQFGLRRTKSQPEELRDLYLNSPNERYIGFYQFGGPLLMLKDPELIKKITVKEFESFPDHITFVPEDIDNLWSKNLFSSTGDKWRKLRPLLSPAFTSSKMRTMFVLMEECANQFGDFFNQKECDIIELEMKDVFTKYTNDVIATTAFGLNCNSLKHPTNDFYQTGKKATKSLDAFLFKIIIYFVAPRIAKFFGVRIFPRSVAEYYSSIVEETIKVRKENGIIRPDIIHLLTQAQKNQLQKEEENINETEGFSSTQESDFGKSVIEEPFSLTTEDIVAQTFIFFLAGFETVSTLMAFVAYELAVNPNIQKKLRDEVDDTRKSCNGKISYEALLKMKYMDMVVSETLRKWPPNSNTDRVCTRTFIIEPELPGEKPLIVEKNSVCLIPIFGLHWNPKFYENPESFDPERFSDENKHKIQSSTYIPFGIGPRNCIGSRFALLEVKLLFFHILSRFEIVPTKKTQIPIVLCKNKVTIAGEKGFHFGFKKRFAAKN